MKVVRSTIFAVALALAVASQASASTMLDFGLIAPTAGTISYNGTGGSLVGSGIQVDNVVGLMPTGPLLNCVGCVLNFTTGLLTGTTANTWSFGGTTSTFTSSISITGTLVDPSNSNAVVASGTLLIGEFGNAMVTAFGGTFKIAGASFSDIKNPDLLAFYGLPSGAYDGNFNISFMTATTRLPPNGFTSSTVLSGDLTNHPSVDLPSSLLLLGSGLVGFAFLTARTRRS